MGFSYVGIALLCLASGWSLGWNFSERRRLRTLELAEKAQDQADRALEREAGAIRALQASLLLMERVVAALPAMLQQDINGELLRLKGLLENIYAPTPELRPGRGHLKVVVH